MNKRRRPNANVHVALHVRVFDTLEVRAAMVLVARMRSVFRRLPVKKSLDRFSVCIFLSSKAVAGNISGDEFLEKIKIQEEIFEEF